MTARRRASSDPDILLAHIRDISQTARTSWFALLALLAFVGVTMMAHEDAAFFAAGVATELPVVGIAVPTISFFIAAPLLMAAFYAHLHIYLISLWDAIADAPDRIGADRLIDRVAPTMISQSAVLHRARTRRDGSAPVRAFSGVMELITVLLVWLSTPLLLAYVFWRSMALHDPWLTLWIGACLVAACLCGFEGFRVARGRLSRPREERESVHARWGWGLRLYATGFAAVVAFLSFETIEGCILTSAKTCRPALLYAADLREARLTPRPADWLPWHLWVEDFEERFRRRENIKANMDFRPDQEDAFRHEAKERYAEYIAELDAPYLTSADLRHARMRHAFLPGADLRSAQMQGAQLRGAQIQGGDLGGAELQGVILNGGRLQGAVLDAANLRGASLSFAELQEADLNEARLQDADLSDADMHRADLSDTELERADLSGANMSGASLNSANMRAAVLTGAHMPEADLRLAQMPEADLSKAQIQGADLREAQMQNAECAGAILRGAPAHFADLRCRGLTQAQLEEVIGDEDTVLPDGLHVWSCWERPPETLEQTLAHSPESEREALRAEWLCNGRPRERTGRPASETEPN